MNNFELTLLGIKDYINGNLLYPYTKVWVQGTNKPNNSILLFTFFTKDGYKMKTHVFKNFRHLKPEMTPEVTSQIITEYIKQLRPTLENVIDYKNMEQSIYS